MFKNNLNYHQNGQFLGRDQTVNNYASQYNMALSQFKSALAKGKFAHLKRRILRRPQRLYDLNDLKPKLSLLGSFYSGIEVVLVDAIVGSEGRTADFDIDFFPVSEAGRERWINMAIVYLSRLPLPPIQLIQIGNAYFVRDGHHRISVGRACGQVAMDAEVVTWKVVPPYPWQGNAMPEALGCLKKLDLPV